MKKMIVLFFIFWGALFAQTIRFGARLEPNFSYQGIKTFGSDERTTLKSGGLDIRGALALDFSENFGLSLRPGIVLGENYGGIAGGIFGSISTYKQLYTLIGFDIMKQVLGGGHSSGGKDVTLPYPVIGAGYKLSKNLSAELQFHYSLNHVTFAYARPNGFFSPEENYKMYWIIKLSIGYNN